MENTVEEIDRNVQDLYQDVKVLKEALLQVGNPNKSTPNHLSVDIHQDIKAIKETLLQQGEQIKSTSNQLSELLTKLNSPLAHDVRLQQHLFGPAGLMQSDTASVSSAYSNNTEDETIRSTGFKTTCMASSIQSWFCDIVKKIPFLAVNDEALEKGIVTPEEHEKFRKTGDEENGKRMLISSIMDKSCETMLSFVNIIGRQNEDLKDSIMSTFDDRSKTVMVEFKEECIQCLIKRRCDLASLCDFYFTHELISRDLLNAVIHCAPQDRFAHWPRFHAEISTGDDGYALSLMRTYLSDNDQYEFHSDIIKQIDRDLKRGRRYLKCRCQKRMKRPSPMNYELYNTSPSSLRSSPVALSPGAFNKRRRYSSVSMMS